MTVDNLLVSLKGALLVVAMLRAGDVIEGADLSDVCVFWTRSGLHMGVLADEVALFVVSECCVSEREDSKGTGQQSTC